MKYTRKEAQQKIDELDNEILKLMLKMDEVKENTIDSDKEDFEKLVEQYEAASEKVQSRFYNYIIATHRAHFGLFL